MKWFQVECWDSEGRHWFRKFDDYQTANRYRLAMCQTGFTAVINEVPI